MKIYIQIVDKRTGVYQTGMIDEPVIEGKEVENALSHFGVTYGHIKWNHNSESFKYGEIEGTTKVVSIIMGR